MDVESLAKQLILQNMTPEQQNAVLESVRSTLQEARANQKRRVSENVGVVVEALNKIENDIRARYDDLGQKITDRVNSIQDGRDGIDGRDGKDGKDGRPGRDGMQGPMGPAGRDGRDGVDGQDGVSVIDAKIDFDGSLIIYLSNGRELNVGEVMSPDAVERIRILTYAGDNSGGGGGSSGLTYKGTWNASTNTPLISSSAGTNGDYYIVSVAGSTDINGITDWQAGDWIIFNGSVWQKIDQSWATAGANSNITSMTGITGGISSPDYIQFDTAATVTPTVGRLQWDADEGTLQVGLTGGNVNLQLGMESVVRVKNDDTVTLTDGMVVYISGANGANLLVKRAQATSDGLSATTLGVVTETIATNGQGYITTFGNVNNLDTTAFTAGDVLYLSPTTAGALTNTKPSAPNHMVTIAVCTKVSAGNGQIFVRVDNGYELDELHNVLISAAASGNTLIYDAVVGVWKNANLTDGTGISITEGAGSITIANTGVTGVTAGTGISASASTGSITITNTAPDQTVGLTGAGTTSVTGTYPNFTITSNDQYTGTVTSVGGTGTVNGISLSGTVSSSGNLTLGGALTGVDLTTQVTGVLPVANGGTNSSTASGARTNLGAAASGANSDITSLTGITGTVNMGSASSLQKNSTNAYTLKNITYLTSGTAATYTTPTGVRALKVTVVGGGGGGGGVDGQATANTNAYSDSGGGSGYATAFIATAESSYTYTVGAGGTGGAAGNNAGTAGGTTEFKNAGSTVVISATGGGGGAGHTGSVSTGASAGNPGVGSITGLGSPGGVIGSGTGIIVTGYGRVISGTVYSQNSSGYCPIIGGGVYSPASTTGTDATNYGEGGSGVRTATASASNYAGGNGYQGLIIIEEYY